MEIGRIKNDEIEVKEINIRDIQNICLEIARQDKKTRRTFNKSKIKSKYVKDLNKMSESFEKALRSGKKSELEKVFNKYSTLMDRYTKLNPKISISRIKENGKEIYQIDETQGQGNISELKMMYANAKQNAYDKLEYNKEMDKKEKHDMEVQDKATEISERNQEKIIEENEKMGRENFRQGMDRAYEMDKFKAELQGGVQDWNQQAIEKYGDSDTGRAWSEMQKNPYKKQLEEINGEEKTR